MTTRRRFLVGVGAGFVGALGAKGWGQAGGAGGGLAADPMRPQFHLLPARNWMNDPNGPVYFKGRYHMFFQYNPEGAVWGNMSWNHAVSEDMIHWRPLPLAMVPTPGGPDAYGCFTGSAVVVGERVYMVYTGVQRSSAELATAHDAEKNAIEETQCLAWSDDPMLVKWTKDPTPIVARPPAGMKVTGFRDPAVWKSGDGYFMTVGSGVEGEGGCVLLYRSSTLGDAGLKNWTYLHKLTSGAGDEGRMWECPEFFALGDGHVLIYSTKGKALWASGVLDSATMTFKAKNKGELDWGAYYAPKTQVDAEGRRILWGWIQERRDEAAMKAAGWSGMMSLPRVMSLDEDGALKMETLPALSTLRGPKLPESEIRAGACRILPRATGEVLCTGGAGKDFVFRMTDGTTELLRVTYDAASHSFRADGKTIALEAGDEPVVHGFVDGSVMEVMLGGRVGVTKRFYYTESVAPDIVVVADGTARLEGWRVKAISGDRLST